jgi:hypothetical protein|tara:strand:+ start:1797 stop:2051 length:255 start_codon:yes stop_codon:yes gene_type:complete
MSKPDLKVVDNIPVENIITLPTTIEELNKKREIINLEDCKFRKLINKPYTELQRNLISVHLAISSTLQATWIATPYLKKKDKYE